MKRKIRPHLLIILSVIAIILAGLCACSMEDISDLMPQEATFEPPAPQGNIFSEPRDETTPKPEASDSLSEDGRYTSTEEVALYLHTYGKLPRNFITKKEALEQGWDSKKGNLWEVTDSCSIGGDVFSNREGLLPSKKGRIWYECDVNYEGGFRGDDRIVYSNDGLIYFTTDHYESFTQLY